MALKRSTLSRRTIPFLLAGILIFILYLYFLVGVENVISCLQRVSPFYYSLAFGAVLATMVFYSLTWQYLLNLLSIKISFRKIFLFVWVGTFIDILIPAESISSELSKVYMVHESVGADTGKVVASDVSHRILSWFITLGGLIGGTVFLFLGYEVPPLVANFLIVVIVGTSTALVLLSYLCFRTQTTWKIIEWILNLFESILRGHLQLTNLKTRAQKMFMMFHQGMETLRKHLRDLALPIIFSIGAWIFDILASFLVFVSLGFFVSVIVVIIVYAISMAVQHFPLGVPSEVGLTEIVMSSLYSTLLAGQLGEQYLAISASATLLIRILTVWVRFVVGYILFVKWVGTKFLARLL